MIKKLLSKMVYLLLSIFGLFFALVIFLYVANFFFERSNPKSLNINFGVTFTPSYAISLGLDWKEVFEATTNDLMFKSIRLSSFWSEIEKNENELDFSNLDYLLDLTKEKNIQVLLVVGAKQPGWPECHLPSWVLKLDDESRKQKTIEFTKKVVERYKDRENIWGWQVENEPFFNFGENCDSVDYNLVKEEVDLIKSLNPKRPIIITDTGEWRLGLTPMKLSDIFGISLYRVAHAPIIGLYNYPFPPYYYFFKSLIVRKFFAPHNQKTIITELQAEPWSPISLYQVPIESQQKLFPVDRFKEHVNFAYKTTFDTAYLWGVEWWYFMKTKGDDSYWEYAKSINN